MLGRIPGRDGFYKLHRHRDAQPIPGLAVYLLQGNLLFFNADYVGAVIEDIIAKLPPDTEWFIFDASATAHIDSTAAIMLDDVRAIVEERGLKFGIVELHSEPLDTLVRSGVVAKVEPGMIFDDLEDVVAAFSVRRNRPAVLREDRDRVPGQPPSNSIGARFAPTQKEPNISGQAVRPFDDHGRQSILGGLQAVPPYFVGLPRNARERFGPIRLVVVDRPAAVGAKLNGKLKNLQFRLTSAAARFTRYSRLALIASVTGIGSENLFNNSFRASSAPLRPS